MTNTSNKMRFVFLHVLETTENPKSLERCCLLVSNVKWKLYPKRLKDSIMGWMKNTHTHKTQIIKTCVEHWTNNNENEDKTWNTVKLTLWLLYLQL
jgi:hypothetical protein